MLAADLTSASPYGASAAEPGSRAYDRIAGPGRVLELPVTTPDIHLGSVYLYYDMRPSASGPAGTRRSRPPGRTRSRASSGR